MIGNDIVDLQLAKTQSNWQRPGFLEKQFTNEEQRIIKNSKDAFLQVWLFWAMKEAAYKCYVQEHKKRFFAPKKMACKILNSADAIVQLGSNIYDIKYFFSDRYVYAIAQKPYSKKMVSELIFTKENKCISQKINKKIRTLFHDKISLKKNGLGVPYLVHNKTVLPFYVSKTHHGNYGAFALQAV